FFSSRRRHTRLQGDWSSDVCSSDLRIASATLAGLRPPAMTTLAVLVIASTRSAPFCQSKALPVPPGCSEVPESKKIALSADERRSEERRVGKECSSRWWEYH